MIKDISKLKTEKGITLVALIITIIILIILAAVSVNAVFKANFIGIATNGTINYAIAQAEEEEKFENLNSKLEDVIGKIQGNKANNGNEEPKEDKPMFTEEQIKGMIGKYVEYKPEKAVNNPTLEGEKPAYKIEAKYTGTTDQQATTEELLWKIWSIDNEKVTLISDRPTTQKISIMKENVYNNGVKVLNDWCSKCYGNEELGAEARNLNLDDIEKVLDKSVWKPEDDYYTNVYDKNVSSNGTGIYHLLTETCKNTNVLEFPYIWQYEEYSNVDGKFMIGEGLKPSEQNELYETKSAKAKGYYELMFNAWYKKLEESNFKNKSYYELIIADSEGKFYGTYSLSTRMTLAGVDADWPTNLINRFLLAGCGQGYAGIVPTTATGDYTQYQATFWNGETLGRRDVSNPSIAYRVKNWNYEKSPARSKEIIARPIVTLDVSKLDIK